VQSGTPSACASRDWSWTKQDWRSRRRV